MTTDTTVDTSGYVYEDSALNASHAYLLPAVAEILASLNLPHGRKRIFELGCGNGAIADALTKHGYQITGIDASVQGIQQAQQARPHLSLQLGSVYDRLAAQHGRFPVVLSLEVVEHLYAPRDFAGTLFDLVEPSGTAIVSTPYHGYWKNLALAVTGKMDGHFTALWDHGHIKFWSMTTLGMLLQEAGFRAITFHRVGRIPLLAKSMIAVARKG